MNDQPLRSQTPTLPPSRSATRRPIQERLAAVLMMITDENKETSRHLLACVQGDSFVLENPTDEQAACVESMPWLAWDLLEEASREQGHEGIEVVDLGDRVDIGPVVLEGLSVLEKAHTLIVPANFAITDEFRQAVSATCPSILMLQAGRQPDNAVTLHVRAEESIARARYACETLVEVLDDNGEEIGSVGVRQALNSLIDLAPHLAPGNVDKVLVGFLQDCIRNRHTQYLQDYVITIVDGRLKLGSDRMIALLCGRATPVAPADWQPEGASEAPAIVNLQGAQLATGQFRGMPPLLHRLLIRFRRTDRVALAEFMQTDGARESVSPVLATDLRMYLAIKDFFGTILNATGISEAERIAVWVSGYGAAQWMEERHGEKHVASALTLAQTAMLKNHAGAVAAMVEALIRSNVEWSTKWEFVDLQKVDLQEVANELRELAGLPLHKWARDMLTSIDPLARWQDLRAAGARATVGPRGSELDQHCASAGLQASGMQANQHGLKIYCWSVSAISGLSEYKLERPPEGAYSSGKSAHWYAVPWTLVNARAQP